jgi:hypothetical protein
MQSLTLKKILIAIILAQNMLCVLRKPFLVNPKGVGP